MNALIVEDDRNLAFLWSDILDSLGYACEVVQSNTRAMAKVLRRRYDLCLLDFFVDDGVTTGLADLIRMRSPSTSILVITGSDIYPNGEHTRETPSVDMFLRKPIRTADLTAILHHLNSSAKAQVCSA
ncbi:MAG: response regulator [Paracoccaceae bacterium]